jgi:hypothetical protein
VKSLIVDASAGNRQYLRNPRFAGVLFFAAGNSPLRIRSSPVQGSPPVARVVFTFDRQLRFACTYLRSGLRRIACPGRYRIRFWFHRQRLTTMAIAAAGCRCCWRALRWWCANKKTQAQLLPRRTSPWSGVGNSDPRRAPRLRIYARGGLYIWRPGLVAQVAHLAAGAPVTAPIAIGLDGFSAQILPLNGSGRAGGPGTLQQVESAWPSHELHLPCPTSADAPCLLRYLAAPLCR